MELFDSFYLPADFQGVQFFQFLDEVLVLFFSLSFLLCLVIFDSIQVILSYLPISHQRLPQLSNLMFQHAQLLLPPLLNLGKSGWYLLFMLEVIADSLLDMRHKLNLRQVVLVLGLVLLFQQSEVVQFGLHDGDLALGVIELVAQDIHFFRGFVELDIGQAVIKRLAGLETLLGQGVAQLLGVYAGCLLESGVIHQIKLTNTLIFKERPNNMRESSFRPKFKVNTKLYIVISLPF